MFLTVLHALWKEQPCLPWELVHASYALKRRDVGEEDSLIEDQGGRSREKGEECLE